MEEYRNMSCFAQRNRTAGISYWEGEADSENRKIHGGDSNSVSVGYDRILSIEMIFWLLLRVVEIVQNDAELVAQELRTGPACSVMELNHHLQHFPHCRYYHGRGGQAQLSDAFKKSRSDESERNRPHR